VIESLIRVTLRDAAPRLDQQLAVIPPASAPASVLGLGAAPQSG
jgi:hypothetical protein